VHSEVPDHIDVGIQAIIALEERHDFVERDVQRLLGLAEIDVVRDLREFAAARNPTDRQMDVLHCGHSVPFRPRQVLANQSMRRTTGTPIGAVLSSQARAQSIDGKS
jgi:hypothetical protein